MKTAATVALVALGIVSLAAQDRLRTMPGYDQFQKMQPQTQGAWVSGAVSVAWDASGRGFTYNSGGKTYQFDLATMKATDDAEMSRLLDKANRLERRLVAMPVNSPAEFAAKYRPTGPVAIPPAGSLDRWLSWRYSLYSADLAGRGLCLVGLLAS